MQLQCKICLDFFNTTKSLSTHIVKKHKIKTREYYEKYLKKPGDEKCKLDSCKNTTKILGINGYENFCSRKCQYIFMSTNPEINNKRKSSMKNRWKDSSSLLNSIERNEKLSKSLTGKKFTKQRKENLRISHFGQKAWNKNKPGCFSKESREKMSKTQKNLRKDPNSYWNSKKFEEEKERIRKEMLNGKAIKMLKAQKNPSKPEVMLREMVQKLYPSAEFQYGILNFAVDVVIPDKKIAIEYDGYFHFDTEEHKEYHKLRQEKIEKEGWKFLRYTIFDKFPTTEKVKEDIEKLLRRK